MKYPGTRRGYMFLFTVIFAVSLFFCHTALFAQERLQTISPEKAVEIAVNNNHEYKITVHKESEAKENVTNAWSQLFPVLDSEASVSRQHADSGFASLSDGQYDIKLIQARLAVNPSAFSSRLALAVSARANAAQELRRIRLKIEAQAVQSYFNVLLAQEMIRLRGDSVASLKANLNDVNNSYRSGAVPKYELLQAQVQLGNAEALAVEARHNYTVMLENFNFILGEDSAVYCADEKVLEAKIDRIAPETVDAEIERLTSIALTNSPALVQVRLNGDMAESARDAQRSYYLCPTFSVGASWGYTKAMPNEVEITIPGSPVSPDMSAITGDDNWQNTWQIKAAANYRWGALFPADSSRSEERKAGLQILENAESAEMLRRSIKIAVRNYYTRIVSSAETINSHGENIKTAMEGLRVTRESYRAGAAKNADLLAAELALTNAKTGYINALNQYYFARAQLKCELGLGGSDSF